MFAIISLFLACGEKGQDTANEPTDTATDTDTVTTDAASPFADSSFNLDASQTTGFTQYRQSNFRLIPNLASVFPEVAIHSRVNIHWKMMCSVRMHYLGLRWVAPVILWTKIFG